MAKKDWARTIAAGATLMAPVTAVADVVDLGVSETCSSAAADACTISADIEGTLIEYTITPLSAGAMMSGANAASEFHYTNAPAGGPLTSYVTDFAAGSFVGSGSGATWTAAPTTLAELKLPAGCNGDFPCDGTPGYVGLRFTLGDTEPTVHYGYAKVGVDVDAILGPSGQVSSTQVQVYSAAYETQPGVDIQIPGEAVPEPGTLGMLAFGALGLAALRARRRN